jgi:hypothetical protein
MTTKYCRAVTMTAALLVAQALLAIHSAPCTAQEATPPQMAASQASTAQHQAASTANPQLSPYARVNRNHQAGDSRAKLGQPGIKRASRNGKGARR